VENPFFGSIPKGVEGGRPQEALFCAKAKRQRQKGLSVRKRSVSGKAPSRNVNQLHVLIMSFFEIIKFYMLLFATYKEGLQKKVK